MEAGPVTLLLTICTAVAGGYIALKLRVPAGALIGAMLSTTVLNLAFQAAYMPAEVKFFTQVATGVYIGAKISRSNLGDLRAILRPALLLLAMMLTFAATVGTLIYSISDLSVPTALFAMAPGGITDMTLASMDFGAESSVVALIQTLRVICTTALLPVLIRTLRDRGTDAPSLPKETAQTAKRRRTWKDLAPTILIGLLCGGVGKYLNIPCGAIAFSMAGCAAFNVATDRSYMPLNLRRFVQMFAGALIGCSVGREQLLQMLDLGWVTVIAIVSFLLLDLAAGRVMMRLFHFDTTTALFACAPGGITDMALIAEEMGADSVKVAGMHIIRLVGIVALYPLIIQVLMQVLS